MHFRAIKLDKSYKDVKNFLFFSFKDPSYRSLKMYNDCMYTCMHTCIIIIIQSSQHVTSIEYFTVDLLFILFLCRLHLCCCCKVNPSSAHTCVSNQKNSKDWPGNAAESVTVFKHWMQRWGDTFVLEKFLCYIGLDWEYQRSLRVTNVGNPSIFFSLCIVSTLRLLNACLLEVD